MITKSSKFKNAVDQWLNHLKSNIASLSCLTLAMFFLMHHENVKHFTDTLDSMMFKYYVAHQLDTKKNLRATTTNNHCSTKICVIGIDDETFVNVFKEKSPIDQCELSKIIENIPEKSNYKSIFIDYHLNPSNDPYCEGKLRITLEKLAKIKKIILLDSNYQENNLNNEIKSITIKAANVVWKNWAIENNIWLVDGLIDSSAILSKRFTSENNGFSQAVLSNKNYFIKQQKNSLDANIISSTNKYYNYLDAKKHISWTLANNIIINDETETILIGGRYGTEDIYTTPDENIFKYGVDLHAVQLVSEENYIIALEKNGLLNFLFDLFLAVFLPSTIAIIFKTMTKYAHELSIGINVKKINGSLKLKKYIYNNIKGLIFNTFVLFGFIFLVVFLLLFLYSVNYLFYEIPTFFNSPPIWVNTTVVFLVCLIHGFVFDFPEKMIDDQNHSH